MYLTGTLQFVSASSPAPAARHLAEAITSNLLHGKHVLWLVSGGSSVGVAVQARRQLDGHLSNLVVMQVDERYGEPGHAGSNWQKLLDAGFDTDDLHCHSVLSGKSFGETAQEYNEVLARALTTADFSIGLFGIGTDGHTAGILPGSPALQSGKLVAAYKATDFERITMTPVAIAKLDAAVVYAAGESKYAALKDLRSDKPAEQQPAQVLKQVKDVIVFSNVMEGNA